MRGMLGAYLVWSARMRGKRRKLRYLWLSHAFERAGHRGSIGRNLRILGDLSLELGDRVAIRDNVQLGGNGMLSIGSRSAINEGCIVTAMEKIEIGDDVMIAPRVYILDVDHRSEDRAHRDMISPRSASMMGSGLVRAQSSPKGLPSARGP